jgi:type IV secretory pathway TrbD component
MIERSQIERIEQRLQSGELPPDFALKRAIMTRYAENHGGLLMASGTVAAVLGFSVIGAMGGIGIALIAAQYLLKWNANRRQDWEAIESGRYAHLLERG